MFPFPIKPASVKVICIFCMHESYLFLYQRLRFPTWCLYVAMWPLITLATGIWLVVEVTHSLAVVGVGVYGPWKISYCRELISYYMEEITV